MVGGRSAASQARADIARLQLLREVGGLYLDCDLVWAGEGDATTLLIELLLAAPGALVAPADDPGAPYRRVSNRVVGAHAGQ